MNLNEFDSPHRSRVARLQTAIREGGCFVTFMVVVGMGFLISSLLFYNWGVSLGQTYAKYTQGQCTVLSRQLLSTTRSADTGTNETYYLPYFKYTVLTAGGRTYQAQGDTFLVDGADHYNTDQGLQQEILNRYTVGKTYPCWYDATNPSQSVLAAQLAISRTVITENVAAIGLLMLGLITFGILFLVLFNWRRKARRPVDEV